MLRSKVHLLFLFTLIFPLLVSCRQASVADAPPQGPSTGNAQSSSSGTSSSGTSSAAREEIEKKYSSNFGHLKESPFAPDGTTNKNGCGNPPSNLTGGTTANTNVMSGVPAVQHPESGDALAAVVKNALDKKDYKMLSELNAMQTFDPDRVDSIQKMEKTLINSVPVKSVVFSAKLADDQAQKVAPSDGDLLVNFAKPCPFPTHGNAVMGNVTQVKFPAMKIDGWYHIHGKRGFGMSDFAP